jgi:myosin heavy subunit
MCESLGNKTLNTVLCESYANATDEDKQLMKETLEQLKLDVNLQEDKEEVSEAEEPAVEETEDISEPSVEEVVETVEDDVEEISEEDFEIVAANTVAGMIDQLQGYSGDLSLEFKPIVIEDKEYEIIALDFEDSEEGKVVVNINYNLPEVEETKEEDNILPEEENPEVEVEVSSDEEPQPEEVEETSEEAVDDGDEEVIESLKEMVRQKDELEKEVRDLKNQKTVSDAEVKDLKEELEKYKTGFMRVSELASKSTKLDKEVKSLKEQLEVKTSKINDLQTKIEKQTRLTESVKADDSKVKALTEKLVAVQTEAENTEKALTEKLEASRKQVQERTNIAKKYKAQYSAVLERYIASKANMLGVRTTDITSRLAESYTLDDIDQVCEDLLDMGRPAFGLGLGKPKVKINESKVNTKKPADPNNGYEIDDDLLILAGLK